MNYHNLPRRNLLKSLLGIPLLTLPSQQHSSVANLSANQPSIQLSLNAYSFNDPLRKADMSLKELLDFTADHHFPALDLTAYYFPTYPEVPEDAFLYDIRRQAYRRGVVLSGTGVRNNFTQPDPQKRAADVQLVRQWIDAAVKLGAPIVRIFAGPAIPEDQPRNETTAWVVDNIRQCVDYGKQHGIIVALQNHNEFITTAAQVKDIMQAVNSEWLGLMLDIGSYRTGDPYLEITETASYAVNWQIKENIYLQGQGIAPDLRKLLSIIHFSGYQGYVNLETLGPGDPYQKVPAFLAEIRNAMDAYSSESSRNTSTGQPKE